MELIALYRPLLRLAFPQSGQFSIHLCNSLFELARILVILPPAPPRKGSRHDCRMVADFATFRGVYPHTEAHLPYQTALEHRNYFSWYRLSHGCSGLCALSHHCLSSSSLLPLFILMRYTSSGCHSHHLYMCSSVMHTLTLLSCWANYSVEELFLRFEWFTALLDFLHPFSHYSRYYQSFGASPIYQRWPSASLGSWNGILRWLPAMAVATERLRRPSLLHKC